MLLGLQEVVVDLLLGHLDVADILAYSATCRATRQTTTASTLWDSACNDAVAPWAMNLSWASDILMQLYTTRMDDAFQRYVQLRRQWRAIPIYEPIRHLRINPIQSEGDRPQCCAALVKSRWTEAANVVVGLYRTSSVNVYGGENVESQTLPDFGNITKIVTTGAHTIACGAENGKIAEWDLIHEKNTHLSQHFDRVISMHYNESLNHIASVSLDHKVRIWDSRCNRTSLEINTGLYINAVTTHGPAVYIGEHFGSIHVYDLRKPEAQKSIHRSSVGDTSVISLKMVLHPTRGLLLASGTKSGDLMVQPAPTQNRDSGKYYLHVDNKKRKITDFSHSYAPFAIRGLESCEGGQKILACDNAGYLTGYHIPQRNSDCYMESTSAITWVRYAFGTPFIDHQLCHAQLSGVMTMGSSCWCSSMRGALYHLQVS